MSYVTGRSVGIGAYLNRLGQRVIQSVDGPLVLTGYGALNKLLGKSVSRIIPGPQLGELVVRRKKAAPKGVGTTRWSQPSQPFSVAVAIVFCCFLMRVFALYYISIDTSRSCFKKYADYAAYFVVGKPSTCAKVFTCYESRMSMFLSTKFKCNERCLVSGCIKYICM